MIFALELMLPQALKSLKIKDFPLMSLNGFLCIKRQNESHLAIFSLPCDLQTYDAFAYWGCFTAGVVLRFETQKVTHGRHRLKSKVWWVPSLMQWKGSNIRRSKKILSEGRRYGGSFGHSLSIQDPHHRR